MKQFLTEARAIADAERTKFLATCERVEVTKPPAQADIDALQTFAARHGAALSSEASAEFDSWYLGTREWIDDGEPTRGV